MEVFDSCSILGLLESTYFQQIFDENNKVIKEVYNEVKDKKDEIIQYCKNKFVIISSLHTFFDFTNKKELEDFLKEQFELFLNISPIDVADIENEEVNELMQESNDLKLKSHFPETKSFLYTVKHKENLVIDDGKAFIFFKNHRICSTKVLLLYEFIMEQNLEKSKLLDLLDILYELQYRDWKPKENEYVLTMKLNFLEKISDKKETEVIIS